VVRSTQPGGGADAAGLRAGTVILAVNGEATRGRGLEFARRRLLGAAGSYVTLSVAANGQEALLRVQRTKPGPCEHALPPSPASPHPPPAWSHTFCNLVGYPRNSAALRPVQPRFDEAPTPSVVQHYRGFGGAEKSITDCFERFELLQGRRGADS
jgi:hypothetical protein